MGLFGKLSLKEKLGSIFVSRRQLDEIYLEVEELLLSADLSLALTERIVSRCRRELGGILDRERIVSLIASMLLEILEDPGLKKTAPLSPGEKELILLVGINGCGKTTTAAKLARHHGSRGRRVLLAAADTFRAAGSEQLALWGQRLGVDVIGGERGADPGSVVYNSLASFQANPYDLLIVDTAGRLQSKEQLLRELEKLFRIALKFFPEERLRTLLVLDASTGQNALQQARKFDSFTKLSGLVLTKIDGTARGGTIFAIVQELRVPVSFVTFGEGADEIAGFDPREFLKEMLA